MRGFSLVETLIMTLVLITGLTACASLFSYSVASGIRNRHRSTAMLLLSNKMDELRNSDAPPPGEFSEHVAVDGTVTPYQLTWRISASRTATIIVFLTAPHPSGNAVELARGSLLAGTAP